MKMKKLIFDEQSHIGKKLFKTILSWLDSPKRKQFNNPDNLLKGSGIQCGQTVLEIGCGSGFFTVHASIIIGNEGKLYSIDLHPLSVEETQKKVNELGLMNVVVKKEDAMNSSFEDSMFDLVLLYGVVPAPVISTDSISKEIYRLLKPGGICAIWTMMPFWSPRVMQKHASFTKMERVNGVFRLRKI